MKKPKKDMAKEVQRYKTYALQNGELKLVYLPSLNYYNHSMGELHHFIQYNQYVGNEKWYQDRGIEQKLILVTKICHEHIENRGIKILTDEEFERLYKISRWKLIFNRRYSEY